MPVVISARANLGTHDARYNDRDGSDWIQTVAEKFLMEIQLANLQAMGGSLTEKINALIIGIHKCRVSLRGEWNTERPRCPTLARNLKRIVETKEETRGPAKLRKRQEGSAIRFARKKRRGTFIAVTPPPKHLEVAQKLPCQEQTCPVMFMSESALKTHFKKKHPDGNYQPPPKVMNPATGKMGVQKLREDKVRVYPRWEYLKCVVSGTLQGLRSHTGP